MVQLRIAFKTKYIDFIVKVVSIWINASRFSYSKFCNLNLLRFFFWNFFDVKNDRMIAFLIMKLRVNFIAISNKAFEADIDTFLIKRSCKTFCAFILINLFPVETVWNIHVVPVRTVLCFLFFLHFMIVNQIIFYNFIQLFIDLFDKYWFNWHYKYILLFIS